MKSLNGYEPWIIRTDFSSDESWQKIRNLIAAPQTLPGIKGEFYAYVVYIDDAKFVEMSPQDIVHSLPDDYDFLFCFIIDSKCVQDSEHPVLVVGFYPTWDPLSSDDPDYDRTPAETPVDEIASFRALPSQIQGIENNLSLANMDFEDYSGAVDSDGVFRGFRR